MVTRVLLIMTWLCYVLFHEDVVLIIQYHGQLRYDDAMVLSQITPLAPQPRLWCRDGGRSNRYGFIDITQ